MPATRFLTILQGGFLNSSNDVTDNGLTDSITGQKSPGGGLVLGQWNDLTDAEAAAASNPTTKLYHGRYMRVLVDSGATAAGVKAGTTAHLVSVAKGEAVVTSFDQALGGVGFFRKGVFLNAATPGKYTFIQTRGLASVLGAASISGTAGVGHVINAVTGGLADDPASQTVTPTQLGIANGLPTAATLFLVELTIPAGGL